MPLYEETTPYAYVKFETYAKRIEVTGYSNIYTYFPQYSKLGVFVNNTFFASVSIATNGSASQIVKLPDGKKTIKIENGLQSSPTNSLEAVVGTFLTALKSDKPLTPIAETGTSKLLIYGDSITVGADSTNPFVDGYANKIRQNRFPKLTSFLAFGYRNLTLDCGNSTKRAAFVSKIQAQNPSILWINIGNNDWAMTTDSTSGFQSNYGAMLDAIHTAMPSLVIYCQTMIKHDPESSTNGNGYVIQDFRDAISSACSTRQWVTLVDGYSFVSVANIPDGTHPNTTGHNQLYEAISTVLNGQ